MPNFPIVDSHVHLYDIDYLPYGWLDNVPQINRTYLLEDFDAARGPVAVDKIVFAEVAVDSGHHLDEARWVQGLADTDHRLCGMVAHAPLEKGAAVEGDLVALRENAVLKGIRRLIEVEVDPSMCLEPGFIEGVKLLPKFGLSFDLCVRHFALIFGVELVRRCPDVTFILDHMAKPGIKHEFWEPWKSQIQELAAMPNVVCKISGVVTEADHQNWKREQLKPYVNHVIESFGFDRVMYGSDWTVGELTHRYPTWVEILDEIVAGSSDEELRKLYRDNAIRTYRLES